MPDLEIEPLLSALEGDVPCGVDLEYDAAFLALLEAGAGKPETQWAAAVPAEWSSVLDKAMELARRTRDLRIAVWVMRSAAHVHGLLGAVRGLQLVQRLIERHWADVHPRIDASEGNDPTMRVNALMPLVHPDAGLADLRAAALTGERGALTVRDLELGLGRVEPLNGEMVPTEDGVLKALAAALQTTPALGETMQAGQAAAMGIEAALLEHLGEARSVDLAPLKALLGIVAQGERRARGPGESLSESLAKDTLPARAMPVVHGSIGSREDAIQTLQRVCDWIERNEPSHPAPLLIRRAQRLMHKNFLEIVRDLMPDGLGQVERLAGIATE